MTSQELYYKSLSKEDLFKSPDKYAWNCVLYYIQFTQAELLSVRERIDIINMVKYQKCLTRGFVRENFSCEVDDDDLLTWEAVYKYVMTE
jgi:hypothetical protein